MGSACDVVNEALRAFDAKDRVSQTDWQEARTRVHDFVEERVIRSNANSTLVTNAAKNLDICISTVPRSDESCRSLLSKAIITDDVNFPRRRWLCGWKLSDRLNSLQGAERTKTLHMTRSVTIAPSDRQFNLMEWSRERDV